MSKERVTCCVKGCDRLAYKRKACQPCYQKAKARGTLVRDFPSSQREKKIWKDFFDSLFTVPEDVDDCIIWPYLRNSSGYAKAYINGKSRYIHRVLLSELQGPPPDDGQEWCASHTCHNGAQGCVNPNHLEWDTLANNSSLGHSHGQCHRGSSTPTALFDEAMVAGMRMLVRVSKKGPTRIARTYYCDYPRGAVLGAIGGHSWKHIKIPPYKCKKPVNPKCVYCNSCKTHKSGKPKGMQRYMCTSCNKTWINETPTLPQNTIAS